MAHHLLPGPAKAHAEPQDILQIIEALHIGQRMPCQRGSRCGHEVVGEVASGSAHHLHLPQRRLIIFASRRSIGKGAFNMGPDFLVHNA